MASNQLARKPRMFIVRVTMAFVLAMNLQCWAETVTDSRPLRALYDASNAAMHDGSKGAALEVMEAVAEGKSMEVILTIAQKAGLQTFFTKDLTFRATEYSAREFAMEMIGRTGLPAALDYLSAVTPERLGSDESRGIYPASKVALHKALLRRETDPLRQIAFLETQLTSATVGQVALWAQEELCNRGSVRSIDLTAQFIKRLDSSSRGDERIAFCRKRMAVIQSHPDRALALGSVLRADARASDQKIIEWAIDELFALHTAGANSILERYATEVAQPFPHTSSTELTPELYMHRGFAQEIRRAVPGHGQK